MSFIKQAPITLHDISVSKEEKRTWLQKVQAYLIRALPGGQLIVFLMTISIDDFQPEKVQRRNANLHTLAAVATFLAAVQAQLLGYSYQNNETVNEVAINLFAFVGLALDVLGAAAGLTTQISTQQVDYQTLKELQGRLREAQSLLEEKERHFRQISIGSPSGNPSVQDLPNLPGYGHSISICSASVSQEEHSSFPVAPAKPSSQSSFKANRDQCGILRKQVRDARKRFFLHMLLALKNDLHRVVCVELMKFGIQSFFLALILFVCHTQPKLIWMSVVAVIVVGILASPLGKTLGLVERAVLQRMDKQAADRVIWLDDTDGDSVFDAAEAREQVEMEKMKLTKRKGKHEMDLA